MRHSWLITILAIGSSAVGWSEEPPQPAQPVSGVPAGWTTQSPRAEIRPAFAFDPHGGPRQTGSWIVTHDRREGLDGWFQKSFPVTGGEYYRIHAVRKTTGVAVPRRSAIVRIVWQDAAGKLVPADVPPEQAKDLRHIPTAEPEHPTDGATDANGWTTIERAYRIPAKAARAVIELHLQWAPNGRVEWSEVDFAKTVPPPMRKVRLATVHYKPTGKSPRANCEECAPYIAEAAKQKADLVVLGETIPSVNVRKPPHELAEPIPGPSSEYFGELAQKHNLHIALSLYERSEHLVYNTAILLGPDGKPIGQYRKVCLPHSEVESGIAPGRDYPVFSTKFGKVGLMICYDGFFPEVARQLTNNGAEVIAWPVWGCNPLLAQARACENRTYIVSSTFMAPKDEWMLSAIFDPTGKPIAKATAWGTVAVAEVDLSQPYIGPYNLGDFRSMVSRHRPVSVAEPVTAPPAPTRDTPATPPAATDHSRLTERKLRVGAAAVDLVADDSMIIGGGIGPGHAQGQEGKLRAVATVIQSGETKLAIVACDVLMLNRDLLDPVVAEIEQATGIPTSHILINATHTHHAPSTCTVHGYERDARFCRVVQQGIVAAVKQADARLTEARLSFALGEESSVGQNSRLLLGDKSIFWVGPRNDAVRPTGPFDPQLPVLAFTGLDRKPIATWFNHSTHTIGTRKPGVRSPSFYGLAAQELEDEHGGIVGFLEGASGSTHNLTLPCAESVVRIKAAVEAALKVAEPHSTPRLAALKSEFRYRIRTFDEAVEDQKVVSYCTTRTPAQAAGTIDVFRKQRAVLAPQQGKDRSTWMQVLLIDDVAIVGVPAEFFTGLGLEIKRRSPFRYTYVAELANDWIGYLPDRRGFEHGGYQTWMGLQSFTEPGLGEAIVDEAIQMLQRLHNGLASR
ncbi:MAG: carbon-nitrogen hydrolase family protein [Gemmataceae bacterium]